MKKLILILLILSFNTYGKCVKDGWFSGQFCFEELDSEYATFDEIEFGEEGPRVPGWENGLIAQLEEIKQIYEEDKELAKELLVDVYMQLDFIDGLDRSFSSALKRCLKELGKAIVGFSSSRKVEKHLGRASRELAKYSRSRE